MSSKLHAQLCYNKIQHAMCALNFLACSLKSKLFSDQTYTITFLLKEDNTLLTFGLFNKVELFCCVNKVSIRTFK